MPRRFARIVMWPFAAVAAFCAGALALNACASVAYSAPSFELALWAGRLVLMTRSPADPAMKSVRLGFIVNAGPYIDRSDVYHWTTALPYGTGTAVPLWMPLAGSAAVALGLRAAGRRGRRPGFCAACGYDRRGLEPGSVCPECGAAA